MDGLKLISEKAYSLPIRSDIEAIYDTHGRLVSQKRRRLHARFIRGGAPAWARQLALDTFSFANMPEKGVTREQMVCWYDSEDAQILNGWTDQERAEIELTIEDALASGRLPGIVRVEPPKPVAPWPAYDKLVAQGRRTVQMVAEKIVEKVREDGYSADAVAEYERETLNRPEVLAALADLKPVEEPEEELIEA